MVIDENDILPSHEQYDGTLTRLHDARTAGLRIRVSRTMVVFQVKRSEQDAFFVESTVSESNDGLIRRLVKIWNTRLRILQLAESARDLGMHGPSKPPAEHGLDEVKEEYEGAKIDKGSYYNADPTGKRNGNGVSPQLRETFERVCSDAETLLGKEQTKRQIALTQEALDEKMDNIRGAVTMGNKRSLRPRPAVFGTHGSRGSRVNETGLNGASPGKLEARGAFPMGLPEFDPVRLTIEGEDGLEGTQAGSELLDENTAVLWMAGKEFRRDESVGDRVGQNEKTRVICKLERPGMGAPGREPGVSEEERKAMMAYYFKRQEELKRLAEADDDDYLASAWADPRQLQRSLRGTTSVRAPGV